MSTQNAIPGASTPAPRPAAVAAPPVKMNPSTITWKEPSKFVTDGSTFTAADFDSYEFGFKLATDPGSELTVVGHLPATPGESSVSVASLNLPQNVVLQVSIRVVAANGVRSKWATPLMLMKIDGREPESPSALVLS